MNRRYYMKKILILLLVLALSVASVVSCGKKNNGGENSNDENQGTTGNGGSNPEEEPGIDKEPEPELPGVDLINADLSDYIEIDEKYYKNYTVNVDPDRVSTLDIENKIIQILCDYKSKEPVEGDGVISVGDVAHIYYKGYYMKDGEKYFFEGGDNSSSSTPHALEIGSGGFIPGFEYNLIGKNPADYTEESPIVVETFFPENYQSAELAGKTAYFIVTVKQLVEYDAPELSESFLRDTVKLTDEDLATYEGEGMVEKFRSYLKDSIAKENGLDVETLSLDAFWKSVMEGAVVKKYPEKQVKEIYDNYVNQLEGYYQYYYSAYYGHDEFMCLYLGIEVGSDWKAKITELAQSSVKQQLIFYHIMNLEGLKPNEEEFDKLLDEHVIYLLYKKNITEDKYETKEAFLADVAEYKAKLIRENGLDYYKEELYYDIGIDAILSYANIVEIAE